MKGVVLFKTACVISVFLTLTTLIQMDQQWKLQIYFERRRLQDGVDVAMLDNRNHIVTHNNSAYSTTGKPVNETVTKSYFEARPQRVNPHDYKFIISNSHFCDHIQPYLVMLCPSKYSDINTRGVIRRTWASIVTSGTWPRTNETFSDVKLVFILGRPDIDGVSIMDELKTFKDIVMVDFFDSYDNLTTKVLMGLKWVDRFCPKTTYVLKVDQDTFVHVPNLIFYLKNLTIPSNGLVAGRVNYMPAVYREGRWNLTWDEYPFQFYPPYLSGNTYVISGNALSRMIWAAEHMPYLKIEDVFFTGIIRRLIQAEIHNRPGFTYFNETSPSLCGFHNPYRISATSTDDELKTKLWQALHQNLTNCYVPQIRRIFGKRGQ